MVDNTWRFHYHGAIKPFALTLLLIFSSLLSCRAHVVQQLFVDFAADEKEWMAEIRFDAGIALPRMRADKRAMQPQRAWLVQQNAEQHAHLREQAEKYLRSCLQLDWVSGEKTTAASYTLHFPEWETTPPTFASPHTDLGFAYFTIQCVGEIPDTGGALQVSIAAGDHPDFMFGYSRVGADNYITAYPGKVATLWTAEAAAPSAQQSFFSFLDYGYRHVIPEGWDHVLFIAALCCLSFSWRPLLAQSLVFTLGHTLTLGLSIAAVLPALAPATMTWVEVMIAGTIVYVAIENLLTQKIKAHRLVTIFLFGLVHGLGFAAVLGDSIRAAENISMPLIAANLGVELGQVTVIAALLLSLHWARERRSFPIFLKGLSAAIALTGGYWLVERIAG